ncbi:MAG: SixA phosphatase family protein [Actinomycetes bacterium]
MRAVSQADGDTPTWRLVLLRHAKAESAKTVLTDDKRPLALNGRKQASRVGMALTAAGLVPRVALVSSALRTRQTWDLASAHLDGSAATKVEVRDELYEAAVRDVLGLLRDVEESARTVLIIGHEPTMAATAAYLASDDSEPAALAQVRVGVPTATYSVLESAVHPWSEWGRGSARLVHVGRPS